MKYNIVFADIDGVFNTISYWKHHHYITESLDYGLKESKQLPTYRDSENHHIFDPLTVEMFNKLNMDINNIAIVVSSTWRLDGVEEIQRIFKNNGFYNEVIDVTPVRKDRHRGSEIKDWLIKNWSKVKNYVILDDDSDMLEEQKNNFVQCSSIYGFTDKELEKTKNILK